MESEEFEIELKKFLSKIKQGTDSFEVLDLIDQIEELVSEYV